MIAAMIAAIVIHTVSQDGTVKALPGICFGSPEGACRKETSHPQQVQGFQERERGIKSREASADQQSNIDRQNQAIRSSLAVNPIDHHNSRLAKQDEDDRVAEMKKKIELEKHDLRNDLVEYHSSS